MAEGVGAGLSHAIPAVESAGMRLVNKFLTGAAPEDVATIENIQRLLPPGSNRFASKEAEATAGRIADEAMQRRIADEAMQRGSVPKAGNFAVRDSQVFSNLRSAQAELQAAKMSAQLDQKSVDGSRLLKAIEDAQKNAAVERTDESNPGHPNKHGRGRALFPDPRI